MNTPRRIYSAPEYYLRAAALVLTTMVYSSLFVIARICGAPRRISYPSIRNWCQVLLRIMGIKMRVEGIENITKGAEYILIANHASQLDIPALIAGVPIDSRIMYKRELMKVPFIGWALWASTFIPIRRQNARDASATLDATLDDLRSDPATLIVFAEGTRSPDGMLQEFKRGAIQLAVKSGREILPVAISGSFDLLPRNSLRFTSGVITLRIAPPVHAPSNATRTDERELVATTHGIIAGLLRD
ncbi:MAG: 1-acyl-sn-glycerol-3-phosphate acyltransferase [Candidatus Kapabacteria bacterium]|nr:1-acyl-sn-glycerol-3-phosphate acyltransferase [Candidatus Kapabacteria bacterium]